MKKLSIGLVVVALFSSLVMAEESAFNRENLSLKAGPTEPGEQVSLVWIESYVYPKFVKDENIISLGVRTTARVKTVKASFDFSNDQIDLTSRDGLSWSNVYKFSSVIPGGAHIVRYHISGNKGMIQRTVDFFVEKNTRLAEASGEVVQSAGWPLTIVTTCTAYSNGALKTLNPGQLLVSVSKMPWYKVVFEDGREGWIPASFVKEPTEDYFLLGSTAFQAKDFANAVKYFKNAVSVDPGFAKGYLALAKSLAALGEIDAASSAVRKALQLDERDIESRVAASSIAQKFFNLGHEKFKAKRYHEALAAFQKTIELKRSSILSWIEMGESYRQLGLEAEAKNTWKNALGQDPENAALRALLGSETRLAVVSNIKKNSSSGEKNQVPPLVADDSLQIIKAGKTSKGTKIEAAIKAVVALTKSLGTPVVEKGWQVSKQGEKFVVSYLCEQGSGAHESFEWLVDIDTRQVLTHNENARLLMSRW